MKVFQGLLEVGHFVDQLGIVQDRCFLPVRISWRDDQGEARVRLAHGVLRHGFVLAAVCGQCFEEKQSEDVAFLYGTEAFVVEIDRLVFLERTKGTNRAWRGEIGAFVVPGRRTRSGMVRLPRDIENELDHRREFHCLEANREIAAFDLRR